MPIEGFRPTAKQVHPELERLDVCVEHLNGLRTSFGEMEDGGERERAWDYLKARFGEFEDAEEPRTGDDLPFAAGGGK